MHPKAIHLQLRTILMSLIAATVTSCYSGNSGYPTRPVTPAPSAELDSGDFGTGGIYQHRFSAAGTFPYHCVHHAPMTGTVQVSASAIDTLANVSIVSSTTAFPSASVKPGGRVVWTNNTGMVHTVTSN